MIFVNGEEKKDLKEMPLSQLLERESFDSKKIAVEINGKIISRNDIVQTVVKDGDHVEVVSFVGGG